jgi:hypothetical protein
MRFLIRHARDGAQGERPGGCGKEEVLRHRRIRWFLPSNIGISPYLVNAKIAIYDGANHRTWR